MVSFQSNISSFARDTFVLAMVDPDAPFPQNATMAEIRHLLAPNMTLNGTLADGALLVNNTPAISNVLSLIGVSVQDVNVLVGLTCSPITVIGVGSGDPCSGTTVSCDNNEFVSLSVRVLRRHTRTVADECSYSFRPLL